MKKQYNTMPRGVAVITILIFSLIFYCVPGNLNLLEHEFKITHEVCENNTYSTDWVVLEAGERFPLDFLHITKNNFDSYKVQPLDFDGWWYMERKICWDLFEEKGLYPDDVNFRASIAAPDIYRIQYMQDRMLI